MQKLLTLPLLVMLCMHQLQAQFVPSILYTHQEEFSNPYPTDPNYRWKGFMPDKVTAYKWDKFRNLWSDSCITCSEYFFKYNADNRVEQVQLGKENAQSFYTCTFNELGSVQYEEKLFTQKGLQSDIVTKKDYYFKNGKSPATIEIEYSALSNQKVRLDAVKLKGTVKIRFEAYKLSYWDYEFHKWGPEHLVTFRDSASTLITTMYKIDGKLISPSYKKEKHHSLNGKTMTTAQYHYRNGNWILHQKTRTDIVGIGNTILEATEFIAYCDTCAFAPWAKWVYEGRHSPISPIPETYSNITPARNLTTNNPANNNQQTVYRQYGEHILAVYPSNTASNLSLMLPEGEPGYFILEIYHIYGGNVFHQKIPGNMAGQPYNIDVSFLQKGTYIIYIKTDNAELVYSAKFNKI